MTSQQFCRTWWQPAMLAVLLSVACSDATGTPSTSPSTPSDPTLAAALSVNMTGATVEQVAYVALDPGTIDAGTTATISNHESGAQRAVSVVNGGFDPVGVPAYVGDTLVVSVATAAGQVVVASVVARPRPPHVVRVDPPKDQVDVPVNMNLTVVFSEPITAGTLNLETLQLRQGSTTVPGTIAVAPATPWLATFTPAQPLVPATTYTFTVTGAITDPNGLTLDSPVAISFVTGVEAADTSVASVEITPQVASFIGDLQLAATARDAAGNALNGRTFVWASSDTNVASVDATGLVTSTGVVGGTVFITATTGGHSGTATIKAGCMVPLSVICETSMFGVGVRTVTGVISQLMPDGTTQPVPNMTYYAWVDIPKVGGYATGARRTDGNGAYHIDNVQDGRVAVAALVGALEQPCMAAGSTAGQNPVINVTLVDPANPQPQRTTTAPAVTGTVYRMIGGVKTPLAGAVVQYNSWVPDLLLAETVSDVNGHYSLCNLQFTYAGTGGYIFATASENRFVYQDAVWTTLTVAGPGTVDIVVP